MKVEYFCLLSMKHHMKINCSAPLYLAKFEVSLTLMTDVSDVPSAVTDEIKNYERLGLIHFLRRKGKLGLF